MTKALFAEFRAKPGSVVRVRELITELATAVRSEPGNLLFEAHQKTDDPAAFFVYEVYVDDDAFAAHLAEEHGRTFNDALRGLVIGDSSDLTWLTSLGSSTDLRPSSPRAGGPRTRGRG
ncbi:MAG: putative quinol monooxygenase [Actinomycetota bacterium]